MVFVINGEYGISNTDNVISGPLLEYFESNNYSILNVKSGIIYAKK
jgi:hypothetical protein